MAFDLVVNISPDDYDEAETIKDLASVYGVDASLISVEAPWWTHAAGSLVRCNSCCCAS